MGFVLEFDEAKRMLDDDPKNSEVIFPYLNGENLNSDPDQKPSRWVICFWDWSDKRAKTYELPWRWIEERVKLDRQKRNGSSKSVNREQLSEKWWQFERMRPSLYHAIGRGGHFERHPDGWTEEGSSQNYVMVCSEVTKHLAFALIPNDYVMSINLDVFRDVSFFGICQSSLHEVWARQYSSKLESRLKYSPGNAFETFPLPADFSGVTNTLIYDLGSRLHDTRVRVMQSDRIGLTKLYNRFHNDTECDPRIEGLRILQCEMDAAVAHAYGWDDLNLGHGFHEVPYLSENDRIRFTISETARIEVLRRLSELNRQRHEEEVAAGLHTDAISRKTKSAPRGKTASTGSTTQPGFDFEDSSSKSNSAPCTSASNQWGNKATDQILAWLEAHKGWFTKQVILTGCGAESGAWDDALAELLEDKFIETHADSNRWRAKP